MKYHIFMGSTLDDLKNERKEIPRIIMELGHIPVTAEYLDNSAKNYKQLLAKTIGAKPKFHIPRPARPAAPNIKT